MVHKKVNLQWIADDAARRSTFQRRSTTLMKKANELATLCGVKVSVVAYKDDDDATPQVYPSDLEARQLLTSFKAVSDDLKKLKKILNMDEYLRCRISKIQQQKGRSGHEKHGDETSRRLHDVMAGQRSGLPNLSIEELLNLKCIIEKRMKTVEEHFQQIAVQGSLQELVVPPPQEQPMLSSDLQARNTCTLMETMATVEESQPEQQDWLADLAWSGGDELSSRVYGNIATTNDNSGPISSGGAIIMPNYNMDDDFEIPLSWDNFLDDME